MILFKKLFRTAWKYKAQFLSMIIMVAIGIGVFVGFNIEWKSIEDNVDTFFADTLYADFRLFNTGGFTAKQLAAVQGIEGVEAATRYLSVNVTLKDSQKGLNLNVTENGTVSIPLVTAGAAYDADSEGLWLGDRFAAANDIKPGDTLELVYSGYSFSAEVVGLCKSGEQMICVADDNQLMPDFDSFGFCFLTPQGLKKALRGFTFYPQINIRSGLDKATLEQRVNAALGRTTLITDKSEHLAYAGARSEMEEGQTMGSVLPVLFLAIGILTMVTTMHRIAANEKVQIGTLKALGFRDRRILRHYTSYGLVIGLLGTALGIAIGYLIAAIIMSENGMMSTYFDLPRWRLVMPAFCWPLLAVVVLGLTAISHLSVRRMLRGTAADALRPYQPKAMRKSRLERIRALRHLPFGTRWNLRDVTRHKSRSAMTLVGIVGCMVLLVGGLGMADTMDGFLTSLGDKVSNYATRVTLRENADTAAAIALADSLNADWQADVAVNYGGKAVTLQIYSAEHEKIRFVDAGDELMTIGDEGAYLCLRLADTAQIGDTITFSPYGSEESYSVRVAGYLRSAMTECIVMTQACAEAVGVPYSIGSLYTDVAAGEIAPDGLISGTQDKSGLMDTYDSFMEIMNLMILILILAAVVLGVVVLYNLGVMSYVERRNELATLKVLGFRDQRIGRLLISQNAWLTVLGVVIGLPAGVGVLKWLIVALAGEYELHMIIGWRTYLISILLTFGVSLAVGWLVARKNRQIDMVEALKGVD